MTMLLQSRSVGMRQEGTRYYQRVCAATSTLCLSARTPWTWAHLRQPTRLCALSWMLSLLPSLSPVKNKIFFCFLELYFVLFCWKAALSHASEQGRMHTYTHILSLPLSLSLWMSTRPGDVAKLERRRRLREAHPWGSRNGRIKVTLLIACRYKLSRPIKDRKASTGFINKNWMWRVTRVT